MSRWADKRRRNIILLIIAICFLFVVFAVVHYKNSKKPTCFDGVQNGTETGIDCGGSCDKVCQGEVRNLIVWWSRALPVSDGKYNLLAYIENQNIHAGIEKIEYEFRVYDRNNVLIAEPRRGVSFVEANKRFAIFEPNFETGGKRPFITFFKILSQTDWKKVNPDFEYQLFQTINPVLNSLEDHPNLHAQIKNRSSYNFADLPVIVIIYNHEGNAITASQTYIDRIQHNEIKDVYFSWPVPFGRDIARIEIIPRINPFLDIEKASQSSL